jgi:hypothetical protein
MYTETDMTEPQTTEGLPLPNALELLAQWIREGREIEWARDRQDKLWRPRNTTSTNVYIGDHIYRAKPRKPRIAEIFEDRFSKSQIINIDNIVEVVELTPEVRAVLEREGLI